MLKRNFVLLLMLLALALPFGNGCSSKSDAQDSHPWQYKGVSVNDSDPTLRHYTWEKVRAPYGPWDKIQLHRYVKETGNPDCIPARPPADARKVLFFNPGTWDRAIHATQDNISQQWYFAANGYDFYAIDFRTAFLPYYDYDQFAGLGFTTALAATSDWTYDVFREDIKACVELAKQISGANKIFMSGFSRGGFHLTAYSAKYASDLKGMISLDGSGLWRTKEDTTKQKTQAEFNAAVASFKAGTSVTYPLMLSDGGGNERTRFGALYPNSRNTVTRSGVVTDLATDVAFIKSALTTATVTPDDIPSAPQTISDVLAYAFYWTWGKGKLTNVYGGFSNIDVLIKYNNQLSRFWPNIQNLEGTFLAGYANCPFLDYHNNTTVNLPYLFIGGELGCPGGVCQMSSVGSYAGYMIQTADHTVRYLPGYGHVDILVGANSITDVKAVELDWMNNRL